ncbi:MAG: UDP-N-acetylmuramoyl-L-alanyl-D-glutamate--2,6-diaminopimelate ligase [Clostridium sp.]|uniref:UDP-N-acetylmuramoyl-L-alanyl-D-glutamate--2, 6-diaminopimelate ligase n=1 Tax=Clostridium sp. TaxID=1506 RepID=UPI003064727F
MKLYKLLNHINYILLNGYVNTEVESISYDSRLVKPNSLFICINGTNVDGHDFIDEAIERGATVVVIEKNIPHKYKDVVVVKVEDTKIAIASISNLFYKEISNKIELVGITGTNGKTTIAHYIKDMLEAYGKKVGVIGTLGYELKDKKIKIKKTTPTTPEALELQAAFKEFIDKGADSIVMEVTSSALAKHRVDFCDFNIGVFTNLSQDHLDEHGTMEIYKHEKMKLFHKCKLGIINIDDEVSSEIINDAPCKILTYGIDKQADIKATQLLYNHDSVTFRINFKNINNNVTVNIPGKFTVYNVLAAISTCYGLGLDMEEIIKLIPNINPVPGRIEMVKNKLNKNVIVDYAHTPDSLEKLLKMSRDITEGTVILIFGCGGDRDPSKRAIMGKIAGCFADYCIITSDNPRTENPSLIINHIEEGIKQTKTPYEKIQGRKFAIARGLELLRDTDLLIIAGKGHEKYQIIGKRKIHFDDIETVMEILN